MADNTVLSTGAGGDTIATDDIGGVKFQRVKIVTGVDGTNDGDTSATAPLPVTQPKSASATLANVAGSATNVTLMASNASRKGGFLFNDSTSALYVKLGATASATSFTVKMPAASFYELPVPLYTGIIDGLWDSATGSARTTELT